MEGSKKDSAENDYERQRQRAQRMTSSSLRSWTSSVSHWPLAAGLTNQDPATWLSSQFKNSPDNQSPCSEISIQSDKCLPIEWYLKPEQVFFSYC